MSDPEKSASVSSRKVMHALIEAMRPSHWIKNAFVAAPILFAGRWDDLGAWLHCVLAVAAFCLLSSCIYLINDVTDRHSDRAHPVKRHRPIASGRLSVGVAVTTAVMLMSGGLILATVIALRTYQPRGGRLHGLGILVWTGAYFVLNMLYSFWLKRHPIVDVMAVALGFVLRAMAGAAAIAVPISPWLVVCTFSLCLFIAVAKRRSEVADLPTDQARAARSVNRLYKPCDLEHMLTVSGAMAILTYALYCLAPRTVDKIGSAHMIWTIPLVVYGVFRYDRLTRKAGRGDPVRLLWRDKAMRIVLVLYIALAWIVLKYGSESSVSGVLDF